MLKTMVNGSLKHQFDADTLSPTMPETVEETGLSLQFLLDLVLKTAFADSNCTSDRVADKIRLPMGIAEMLLQHLYREHGPR